MSDSTNNVDDLIPVEYRSILERTEQRKIEAWIAAMSIAIPICLAAFVGLFAVFWWLDSLSGSVELGSIKWNHGLLLTVLGPLLVFAFCGGIALYIWARRKAEGEICDLDFQQILNAMKREKPHLVSNKTFVENFFQFTTRRLDIAQSLYLPF